MRVFWKINVEDYNNGRLIDEIMVNEDTHGVIKQLTSFGKTWGMMVNINNVIKDNLKAKKKVIINVCAHTLAIVNQHAGDVISTICPCDFNGDRERCNLER